MIKLMMIIKKNDEKHNQIWYNHPFHLSYQVYDLQRVIQKTYYIITPQIHLHPSDKFILRFSKIKKRSVEIVGLIFLLSVIFIPMEK